MKMSFMTSNMTRIKHSNVLHDIHPDVLTKSRLTEHHRAHNIVTSSAFQNVINDNTKSPSRASQDKTTTNAGLYLQDCSLNSQLFSSSSSSAASSSSTSSSSSSLSSTMCLLLLAGGEDPLVAPCLRPPARDECHAAPSTVARSLAANEEVVVLPR